MTFTSLDAVIYTAVVLVPGFIWSAILSMLVPRRVQTTPNRVIEFLTLSCVNHALWIWMLIPLFKTEFRQLHPVWSVVAIVITTLVSPVVLGVLTGWAYQHEWPRRVLGRFGVGSIHQIPTAWDYRFSTTQPCWAIVRLKDGSRVYGLFHHHSFAGDDPQERDLFLEAQYVPTEGGKWAPVTRTAGILIKGDQIAAIEFKTL